MSNRNLRWSLVLLVIPLALAACNKQEETRKAEGQPMAQSESQSPALQPTAPMEPPVAPKGAATEPMQESGKEMAQSDRGQNVYQQSCSSCHNTGLSGAPKVGDKAGWAERLAEGREDLIHSALNGTGAMPAKGGHPSLSEEDVRAAVDYMLSTVQ